MIDLGPLREGSGIIGGRPAAQSVAGLLLAALVAILALAPLAPRLAMGEALAAAALGLVALGAGALAFAGFLQLPVSARRILPALAGFAALALWLAVQALLPLPPGWAPLWDEARAALPSEAVVPRLSLDPGATLDALLWLLAAGAGFWLAVQLGRTGARAYRALSALVAIAAIEAAAFLLGAVPAPHLAGTGVSGALALLFARMAGVAGSGRGFGPALLHLLQHLATYGAMALGAVALLGTALVAAGAGRAAVAGALATLVALAAAPSLGILRRRSLVALWLVLALVALALGAAALHAGDEAGAAAARRAALFALLDHPLTGVGLGAADAVMPLYREAQAEPGRLAGLLALALGAGLPATAALAVAILSLAGLWVSGLRRRRRYAAFPAAALGTVAAAALSDAPSLAGLLAGAVAFGLGTAHSFRTGKD
jgi:hypothetical protein